MDTPSFPIILIVASVGGAVAGVSAHAIASLFAPERSGRFAAILLGLVAGASLSLLVEPANRISLFAGFALATVLIAGALIDMRTRLLPDVLSLTLAILGLGFGLVSSHDVLPRLLGAAAVLCLLLILRAALFLRRKQHGLGSGDVLLMGAVAVWLAPEHLPHFVLASAVAGLGWHAAASFSTNRSTIEGVPFAPAIGLAAWSIWFCENTVL